MKHQKGHSTSQIDFVKLSFKIRWDGYNKVFN